MQPIVVCVKIVPDVSVLRADPATGAPALERAPRRISEFDETAIEEAVRLREAGGGDVTGLSLVTTPPPREVVLKALATGLDRFILVHTSPETARDSRGTALLLS